MVRKEDEGGKAEVVWTCHEKIPRVYRKKDDGFGVLGKRKAGRLKRQYLDLVIEDMAEVGAKETDVQNRTI